MAKKVRTPAPPRRVQAPQRRVEQKQRRQLIAPGDYKSWAIGALALIVVVGAIVGIVIASGGGGGAKQSAAAQVGPDLVGNMAKLPGIQLGKPPWKPQTKQFQARLNVLGIASLPQEALQVHTHSHLDIYDTGKHVTVPRFVGFDIRGKKFYGLTPLHTHDTSGIIHMEADSFYPFKLGQFFDIWGVRFTNSQIGAYYNQGKNTLQVYVNGKKIPDPVNYKMQRHDTIVVGYGPPGSFPTKIPANFPNGL